MTQILRMYRGDDRAFPLTVEWDGAAVDVSMATDIWFTARHNAWDTSEPVIALTLFDGVEYDTDGQDGKIVVSIPASATLGLGAGTVLLWDVEVQGLASSGEEPSVRSWPEADGIPALGKLVVVGDVSRTATS